MNISQTISVEWWPTNHDGEVLQEHREQLQAAALEQAAERVRDGYREGELTCWFADSTGAEYRGYWSVSMAEPAPGAGVPPAVRRALDHVSVAHPDVTHVAYDRFGRWMFFTDDHAVPKFSELVDTGILEDAADAVPGFPAIYYREG